MKIAFICIAVEPSEFDLAQDLVPFYKFLLQVLEFCLYVLEASHWVGWHADIIIDPVSKKFSGGKDS